MRKSHENSSNIRNTARDNKDVSGDTGMRKTECGLFHLAHRQENADIEERLRSILDGLELEANAKLVLTDSGGVQEETSILKVPCVTLRDNTERPETLEVGSNVLVGVNRTFILDGVKSQLSKERIWQNPFGDGNAGSRIVKLLMQPQTLD